MTIDEAIDRNKELKGELLGEGRLEKADAVQLSIEALKLIAQELPEGYTCIPRPLPGETEKGD